MSKNYSYVKKIKIWIVRQLRLLEKYTKTDNIYIIKSGIEMFLGSSLGLVTGVIMYILYSYFLSTETLGVYKYYLSLYALFGITTFTGIDSSLGRSVARGYDGSLATAFRQKFFGGLCGSIIGLIIAIWYFMHGEKNLALGCILISTLAPVIYASSLYGNFLVSKKKFTEYRKTVLTVGLVSFCILVVSVLIIRNPVGLFAMNLISNTTIIAAYIHVSRRFVSNEKNDPELIPYGRRLSLVEFIGTFASQVDSLLVFHFLGAAPLAVYSIANMPVDQVRGFLKIGSAIAYPKISAQSEINVKNILHKAGLMMLVACFTAVIYVFLIPIFFHTIIPRYNESIAYSQVLVFTLIFASPTTFLVTFFYARGATKNIFVFNLVNYGSLILFNLIGVLYWGIWGVVYASFANRTLIWIFAILQVICIDKTKPGLSRA
ncbi:oligosaccharide flippase family protein [Candidatus Uhrbacteria bacterium]|nr:oligosaccharide flippase family protein [Candidatus Uhrbacteria bacterium]